MSISIQIERDTGVAIATCSGVLRLDDAKQAASALWKTPDWPGRAVVWDFRAAEFDVTSVDTREIADFILRHQPEPPPLRVAFITPRDADFGMARMFEVFREDPGTAFRVFLDHEKGCLWAGSDSESPA